MSDANEVLNAALALPREERMGLAEKLWASVEDEWSVEDADPEWRAAWEAEIKQRIEDVREGKSQLIEGDVVMRELREQLKK